jgi:ribonuclease R
MLTVIHGHGLPLAFPDAVEDAARAALHARRGEAGSERMDRRDLHVFTIDPADARDHDDALSITVAEDGSAEVGVHIADVSHFVEEGGALDLEAFTRGTSVYLVDRVIPMLPAALSSDACSLLPDMDRFAVSVFATLDGQGRVREHRFERTTIRSRRKLSYEEAQALLDGPALEGEPTWESLKALGDLAQKIRNAREARGAIDFDLPEAKVLLGSKGEPVDIVRVERLEAHRLIEDYMLLANELVARAAEQQRLPVLYRVHDPPPTDKLVTLRQFLSYLGLGLGRGRVQPKDLQEVMARVRGKPEEGMVARVLLRSMSRAQYDGNNRGHFGLAARWYCHFTSPIRRYPDLWTHRVLIHCLLEGQPSEQRWTTEAIERIAVRSSDRERVAESAERESVDLKKVQYMERHLGEVFDGTISGVTAFGFFVTLDDVFVDGLVHVNSLEDDYYVFQEHAYRLVGERTRRTFRLGDRVTVLVSRVDRAERLVDFVLVTRPT